MALVRLVAYCLTMITLRWLLRSPLSPSRTLPPPRFPSPCSPPSATSPSTAAALSARSPHPSPPPSPFSKPSSSANAPCFPPSPPASPRASPASARSPSPTSPHCAPRSPRSSPHPPRLLQAQRRKRKTAGENGEPFIEPACKEDAGESSAGLARLELLGWKQMQELPAEALTSLSASLTHITISNCPALSTLPDELCHLPHLRSLTLSFLPLITSLPASLHLLSHSLHHLDITSCDMLQSLPASLTALSALRSLNVSACGALARLPSAPAALPPARAADREAGAGNGGSGNRIASNSSSSNTTTTTTQAPLPLLPSLTSLRVALCARLTALPRTWMHLPSLQELILDSIVRCSPPSPPTSTASPPCNPLSSIPVRP
ncbi:unnamed protein product [Closterium sp. Naga37s-1]|nr:unnamed protein product [Closterium sp. Naga37s-1]